MQRFSVTLLHRTSPGLSWQPDQPADTSSELLARMDATSNCAAGTWARLTARNRIRQTATRSIVGLLADYDDEPRAGVQHLIHPHPPALNPPTTRQDNRNRLAIDTMLLREDSGR